MKKMTSINLSIVIIYIFQTFFYTLFLNRAINKLNNNYFIYLLVSIFLGISIIILFTYLFKNNEKGIFAMLKSKILIIILMITPLIFSIFTLNFASQYINFIYLHNIDKIYVIIALALVLFYLLKNNTLSFFRSSTLIFYFYVFLEIITILLLIPYIDINNLLPITIDLTLSINNSYLFLIIMVSPIMFLLLVPKNLIKDDKNSGKKIFLTYIIGSLIIIFKSFLVISILGYNALSIYNYPDIIMYKNIELFSILERVEWLLCFNSITNFFFLISLSSIYIKEGIDYLLNLKGHYSKTVSFFITLIILLGSIFLKIDFSYIIYSFLIFLIIHLFYAIYRIIK